VAADQPGPERLEVPFVPAASQHLSGFETELLEQHGEFVDQCDIDVALNVLNDLGRFGDTDR